MAITTRQSKGAELSWAELDTNFTDLRDGVDMKLPSGQTDGIKVDSLGTPSFPWIDVHSTLHTDPLSANSPAFVAYHGNVKARQFDVGDEAFIEFHIPHEYLMGSEVFIHAHWSIDSATVVSGTVTWLFELLYAKGHNQQSFAGPTKMVSVSETASLIQHQHMVAETSITSVSGSSTSFPVGDFEPDGVIMCRVTLDANNIVDSVEQPKPFLHFVDLHMQSTGIGTKHKNPNPTFWG